AFSVWDTQGRPEIPSASQRSELEAAMAPVLLETERVTVDASGTVTLSFDLPRFGISLLTFTPFDEEKPAEKQSDAGCSCRLSAPARPPVSALVALAIGLATRRRRLDSCSHRFGRQTQKLK